MTQLNRAKLVLCPHCKMTVLPEKNGDCPSCQHKIAESTIPVQEEETGIEELEIEEELEPEELTESVETEAEEEELAEDENWLASEPDYPAYLKTAQQITRRFWELVVPSLTFAAAILGFLIYVGFKDVFNGATIYGVIAFAIGAGMAALLTTFAFIQGNRNIEAEVTHSVQELPGFDVFYELYRPHLRNRFWTDEKNAGQLNKIFLAIIQNKYRE